MTHAMTSNYTDREASAIRRALAILSTRLSEPGPSCSSPSAVRDYLRILLADRPHEVFAVLWMDAQNCFIAFEELFRGTLTQTSVYPREVVKSALRHNAAAVIFAHNHPSGHPDPSRADLMLTASLMRALSLVDVRVLDHFIVAGMLSPTSLAERGLLGCDDFPQPKPEPEARPEAKAVEKKRKKRNE